MTYRKNIQASGERLFIQTDHPEYVPDIAHMMERALLENTADLRTGYN